MHIASAKDLVFDESHSWRYMSMNARLTLNELQKDWTDSERKLLDNEVKDADVNVL